MRPTVTSRAQTNTSAPEASDVMRSGRLEEVLLLVGKDSAVRSRVCNAGEAKALSHLVIIEEATVRLVNGTFLNLARAG